MVGRRSSVGRASLVVASVLLLVISSLLLPFLLPRNANVWLLGSLGLSDLPPRAPRLRAKALCSKTGSTRSPTAGTVARLLPRLQLRSKSQPERQELLALAAKLRAVGDEQTAQRLEEIAPAPEQTNPTSPKRLLKAWNAAKNAAAQKTNQHAAMVDKVSRWSVELDKARQTMLDLAVEVYDAEQAERKGTRQL